MGKNKRNILILSAIILIFVNGALLYYFVLLKPKDSLELYQSIQFSGDFEEVQELMLEGYEENITEEEYDMIKDAITGPNEINQITLFEYGTRTIMVVTTPGTEKFRILEVEELPKEVREYFQNALP